MTLLMALLYTETNSQLGQDVSGSLPNITGSISDRSKPNTEEPLTFLDASDATATGCIERLEQLSGPHRGTSNSATTSGGSMCGISFDASKSNRIYSASAGSDVVRPTSIGVSMWKRIL